jgi:hypothetical protein
VLLQELIAKLNELDDDRIICVKQPWSEKAESQLAVPDENLSVPADVKAAGYAYFLEVHVAKEVVGVFGEKSPTLDEVVRLLVHYAENDAYPDWVYSR